MALKQLLKRKTAHQNPQLNLKCFNRSKSYKNEEKEKQDEKQKGKDIREAENPTGAKTPCFDKFSCDFGVILMASTVNYLHCPLLIFQMTSDLKMSCLLTLKWCH
jgi:ADP-ribosylglycohydrolase